MQYQSNILEINQRLTFTTPVVDGIFFKTHKGKGRIGYFLYLPYSVLLNTGNYILSEFQISLN